VLAEASGRCEKCGVRASQVHHKTYRRDIERAYRSDLVALCRDCHKDEHGLR
jgi:5-methylcytosine-specific restriction endonuclease McrA